MRLRETKYTGGRNDSMFLKEWDFENVYIQYVYQQGSWKGNFALIPKISHSKMELNNDE